MVNYMYLKIADVYLIYGVANYNGREAVRMYCQRHPAIRVHCKSILTTPHHGLCNIGLGDMYKVDVGR